MSFLDDEESRCNFISNLAHSGKYKSLDEVDVSDEGVEWTDLDRWMFNAILKREKQKDGEKDA